MFLFDVIHGNTTGHPEYARESWVGRSQFSAYHPVILVASSNFTTTTVALSCSDKRIGKVTLPVWNSVHDG
jgi:hypothetical protein